MKNYYEDRNNKGRLVRVASRSDKCSEFLQEREIPIGGGTGMKV